jgi:hypothetical protein
VHNVLQDAANIDVAAALQAPIALRALSLDALLWHEYWRVVGHVAIEEPDALLPAYKESQGTGSNVMAVDFSGGRSRKATADEVSSLPFRTIVAPIDLENALRALFGRSPWLQGYEELRRSSPTSKEIFA